MRPASHEFFEFLLRFLRQVAGEAQLKAAVELAESLTVGVRADPGLIERCCVGIDHGAPLAKH